MPIDAQVVERERIRLSPRRGAAQHCLDTREQFECVERLRDIVIGTDPEPMQTTAAIFSIEANGYPLPTGRIGQFSNDGFKRSNGFEVESTAHPRSWSLIAAYTFNSGNKRIGFPGQSLMNAARNSGSVWATWTRRDGNTRGLTFGGGVFAVGERVANLFETIEIPSYARIDGLVRYERAKWNLQLNLKNVTGERYYETDAVQGLLMPGAPFSPELTFRLKL